MLLSCPCPGEQQNKAHMPKMLNLAIIRAALPAILFAQVGYVGFVRWLEGCNKYLVACAHISVVMYRYTHVTNICREVDGVKHWLLPD